MYDSDKWSCLHCVQRSPVEVAGTRNKHNMRDILALEGRWSVICVVDVIFFFFTFIYLFYYFFKSIFTNVPATRTVHAGDRCALTSLLCCHTEVEVTDQACCHLVAVC